MTRNRDSLLRHKTCPACGREVTEEIWKARRWGKVCNTCHKRLYWRPANSEAVERDREASRRWKRQHLGQPGLPKGSS